MDDFKPQEKKLPDLSPILSLPPELRALIFKHTVTFPLILTHKLDPFLKDTYTEAVQPPLTRVSRQIRAESLPLFYESNEFVLHTECAKSDDARRWLRCNAQHLSRIHCISFWLRYVNPPPPAAAGVMAVISRTGSQGAFSVTMRKGRRGQRVWKVEEGWEWISVVRRPRDVEGDGGFLVGSLKGLLEEGKGEGEGKEREREEEMRSNDYYGVMMDLRMSYVNYKGA